MVQEENSELPSPLCVRSKFKGSYCLDLPVAGCLLAQNGLEIIRNTSPSEKEDSRGQYISHQATLVNSHVLGISKEEMVNLGVCKIY